MPDQLAGLIDGATASADDAPGTAIDIEKITADLESRLTAQFEERAKGFQRLVSARDEQLQALQQQLKEYTNAGLSEDERAALELKERDDRIRELESQIELSKLSGTYGEEMPFFQRLLAAPSAEEQLKVMRELRAATAAPAPAPAAQQEPEVPDVDLNRPMRQPQEGVRLPDGTVMNDALADRILGTVGIQADVTQRRLRPSD